MNIVLDFDGTLGDTRSLIVKTMRQTIARLSLPECSEEMCASTIGLPLKQAFMEIIPMNERTAELCAETYTELFLQNNKPGCVPVFPHVVETLAELRHSGHVLSIASSRGRQSLLDFIDQLGMEGYISCVVSANDVEHAKPAPDMVLKILAATRGRAEETLVVGDTKFDIQMGRSAGVKSCAVTYGNGTTADFDEADYIIDSFDRLLRIVPEIRQ